MKKTFFSLILLLMASIGFSFTSPIVNEKVLEAFKKTFHNPQEIQWYENDEGYEVRFMSDEINSKVWYDREGNILKTHRYYNEFKLPPFISGKLKKKYPEKTIFGVTEITNEAGVSYYIKIEDEKNWLTIKAYAQGYLEVIEKYRKT